MLSSSPCRLNQFSSEFVLWALAAAAVADMSGEAPYPKKISQSKYILLVGAIYFFGGEGDVFWRAKSQWHYKIKTHNQNPTKNSWYEIFFPLTFDHHFDICHPSRSWGCGRGGGGLLLLRGLHRSVVRDLGYTRGYGIKGGQKVLRMPCLFLHSIVFTVLCNIIFKIKFYSCQIFYGLKLIAVCTSAKETQSGGENPAQQPWRKEWRIDKRSQFFFTFY